MRLARSFVRVARVDSERLDKEDASTGATIGAASDTTTGAGGTVGVTAANAGRESVGLSVVTRPLLRTKIPQNIGLSRSGGILTLSKS